MRVLPVLALLASVVLLAGCPKKPTTVPEGDAGSGVPSQTEEGTTGGAAGGSVGDARTLPGDAGGAAGGMPASNVIYFDFDKSEIRPEFTGLVSEHARRLAAAPGMTVRLEGHTDERGSREYNIALGERRAQAVRRALMLGGAGDPQLVTVSYGEERPAVDGEGEDVYAQNRRVVIVYGN